MFYLHRSVANPDHLKLNKQDAHYKIKIRLLTTIHKDNKMLMFTYIENKYLQMTINWGLKCINVQLLYVQDRSENEAFSFQIPHPNYDTQKLIK